MQGNTRLRIAYAEAITQTLWMKGIITTEEKIKINKMNREKLEKDSC